MASRPRGLLAALVAVGVALAPPAAASSHADPPELDLNGEWTSDEGERVRIRHRGSSVQASLLEGGGCPYGGSREYFLSGQLAGETLSGSHQGCTVESAKRLVTECGIEDPFTVSFAGRVAPKEISGTYESEGWAYDEKDGRMVNCRRDQQYGGTHTFTLTRECDPREAWDRIHEYCHDTMGQYEDNEAQIAIQEQRFEENFTHARQRFVSFKVLGLGSAKAGVKLAILKRLKNAVLYGVAAYAVLLGGAVYLATEVGHAWLEIEDGMQANEAVLEMLEQNIEINEACIAALTDLEACTEESEEERAREEARQRAEDLRRRAEEMLEHSGRYGDIYEDAQGNVYRGQDALKAAMRDLESRERSLAPSRGSIRAALARPSDQGAFLRVQATPATPDTRSPDEVLRDLLREGLRQGLGREPTAAELAEVEAEVHATTDAEVAAAAARDPAIRQMLEASRAFGAVAETLRAVPRR